MQTSSVEHFTCPACRPNNARSLCRWQQKNLQIPSVKRKELQAATNGEFFWTDIACKYWPYLEKASVSMLELRPLLQMRPFLSVMHAKAHSTKCQIIWQKSGRCWYNCSCGGRNGQQQPVSLWPHNQVSARNDMLTVQAIGWNQRKQEGLQHYPADTSRKAQRREDLSSELGCPENIVNQWVQDVRQKATDGSRCDDQHNLQK
ncbi:uncharacterized protein [Paramisgurnus dabryanus]|uniref:uncharacterized protein n=1 Tax=Paramisgurnus dabryanus TaxID=90735 RepID=UPI0031F3FFA0